MSTNRRDFFKVMLAAASTVRCGVSNDETGSSTSGTGTGAGAGGPGAGGSGATSTGGPGSMGSTSTGSGGVCGGQKLFVADFSNLNANGSNLYNFANRFPNNVGGGAGGATDGMQNWEHTHLATGGPGGTPCAHISMFANRLQYQMGWTTPDVGGTWNVGDEIFFRFAIRYDDEFIFVPDWRNKFILHGSTGVAPQSRIITYMNTRTSNLGACLGWQNYVSGSGQEWFDFSLPAHFGLVGPNDWSNFGSDYGSLGVHVNIGWTAAGPVLVTAADSASAPAPGPNSAAPNDGWYYGQIAARSGLAGSSLFRIWMNNNDEANPTVTQSVWDAVHDPDLGVEGWDGGTTVGGYVDKIAPQTQGYRLAGFEVGTGFCSNWYPG